MAIGENIASATNFTLLSPPRDECLVSLATKNGDVSGEVPLRRAVLSHVNWTVLYQH